jgi:hypothetical protein
MSEPTRAHLKYLEWYTSAGCVGQSAAGNWIAEIEAERDTMEAEFIETSQDLQDRNLRFGARIIALEAALREVRAIGQFAPARKIIDDVLGIAPPTL